MSVAFYIVAESEIDGFDPFVSGKALGRADADELNEVAERAEVTPLMVFFGMDPAELSGLDEDYDDDSDDEDEPGESAGEEIWFDAADGLTTIQGMLRELSDHPDLIEESQELIEDLEEFETVLVELEKNDIRWYLAIDY